MRIATMFLLILTTRTAVAQVGGNVGYGEAGGRKQAEQNERAKRQVTKDEAPPSDTSIFLDANVLLNVKADEYVAMFGVVEEAETVEACQSKMDTTIAAFIASVEPLGVPAEAIFVDLTAQTRIYKYAVEDRLAREELGGFELKKTVAVRYRDKNLLDRLLAAASRERIYDLIKVDYIVNDLASVQERLAEAAAAAIKSKAARHERLLGIKLRAVPQVYAERQSMYQPVSMYDSYIAAESEDVSGGLDRSRVIVQSLRKSRTFYYDPLTADGFDRVIEPVVIEPVVQFTLYLKLKYEIETRR